MLKWLTFLSVGMLSATHAGAVEPLDFNRDIRPILSENCLHCHGKDAAKRQAELRLDDRESAVEKDAIAPGDVEASKLIERITTDDVDLRMPPADSGRTLTQAQIDRLAQWIREGAPYDRHWSFKPIVRHAPPGVTGGGWPRRDLDYFVLATMDREKLSPAPRAPLTALLRRISFDVIGLPPTVEQLRTWQAAADPIDAALNELLSSRHYGERMAAEWLDVARYADTHGFNNDTMRSMWRWRDWVIDAFNNNLAYDRFITEQLAGDLLPDATLEQKIATGFNRNHVINSEGGIIDEEYRVEYVADRVRTTSLAWMGLTIECARCHDHKFDPFSQRDYYQLFAFFNNFDETGEDGRVANASPLLAAPTAEQQAHAVQMRDGENALLRGVEQALDSTSDSSAAERTAEPNWKEWAEDRVALDFVADPLQLPAAQPVEQAVAKTDLSKGWTWACWVKRSSKGGGSIMSTMDLSLPKSSSGYGRGVQVRLTEVGAIEVREASRWPAYSLNVISNETLTVGEWRHVCISCVGTGTAGVRMFLDGVEVETRTVHEDLTGDVVPEGTILIGRTNAPDEPVFNGELHGLRLIGKAADEPLEQLLWAEIATRDKGHASESQRFVRTSLARSATDPEFVQRLAKWQQARRDRLAFLRSFPTVMVAQELAEVRPTHLLERGQYDAPREEVMPDVPTELGLPLPDGVPRNRLALAKWLTDPRNPLTARVVVNRLWQSLFGVGIVKTVEDFGVQSEWPSHPQLLDWLASELIDSGWDMKHMVRIIIESSTYQQDSAASPELWARDPENRLLARGPRQRLSAEMIRDQALVASGLLARRIGGPSVYPYQPADLYQGIIVDAAYPGTKYEVSQGDDQYRRSLYTFWKRTVPHPTMTAFDAPDREFCTARRFVTNTPLQALTLMNDPTFLEPARRLGQRMIEEGGGDEAARVAWGFELVASREPSPAELEQLIAFLQGQHEEFASGRSDPASVLEVGASPRSETIGRVELAAYASFASLLMNLDEVLTRN